MTTTPSNPLTREQPNSGTAELLGNLPLRYIDGPDYCTVKDATDGDFALTIQPDLLRLMEQAAIEFASLKARIADLESNEKAYEEIIGPMTYREVSDRIRGLTNRALDMEAALIEASVALADGAFTGPFVDQALKSINCALQPKESTDGH